MRGARAALAERGAADRPTPPCAGGLHQRSLAAQARGEARQGDNTPANDTPHASAQRPRALCARRARAAAAAKKKSARSP